MFDFGDTSDYSEEARRELFRAAFDNIEFFLNSVFKLDTSPQQTTMFKYLVQAMTASPNATLSDMQTLMEKENYPQYAKHFSVLDFRVQKWHVERLYHKDFAASRGAVHSRLDGLLADPFFAAMFSDPRNKLDLFDELNLPKVILVNTDGLGGALEAFGRLFISKLDEAMIKRKAIPKSSKLPVYFYIDEASDYIKDEPIVGKIINKLGKQKLGMIIAVQGTEQITSTPARDALQRAPIQCWTLKSPIVNISQDRLEPVQVTVPWIAIISWLPHRLRNPSAAQLMQPTIRHVCHHCGAEQQSKRGQNHELSPRHHTYSWPSL